LDSALAKALNLSVEEIQAARDDGTTWAELASQQGASLQALQTAIVDAHKAMIDQALADGAITQAQADALKSHLEAGPGFGFQRGLAQPPQGGMRGPGGGGWRNSGQR
jgi:hypothetical protein